jgi:2-succinyl-6-hydroxy-2,4-cyclohexadiene-1-carboxylate synthase
VTASVEHAIAVDGLRLRAVERGPRRGMPVVILHGFTGSSQTMSGVARALESRWTICVDLVGHGRSDAPLEVAPYGMRRCVRQVVGAMDALGASHSHLLGYSMGGRVALELCATHPRRVASALVVGTSTGIADPEQRRARVRDDEALADAILRDGVPAFVDRWMALPLFASQRRLGPAALAEAREQRLCNRAHALANSLRGMGAGAQEPLQARLASLTVPVCLAVGDEDAKFRAIGADLARRIPRGRLAIIEKAGHAAHLENPDAFGDLVESFLREVEAQLPRHATQEDTLT